MLMPCAPERGGEGASLVRRPFASDHLVRGRSVSAAWCPPLEFQLAAPRHLEEARPTEWLELVGGGFCCSVERHAPHSNQSSRGRIRSTTAESGGCTLSSGITKPSVGCLAPISGPNRHRHISKQGSIQGWERQIRRRRTGARGPAGITAMRFYIEIRRLSSNGRLGT